MVVYRDKEGVEKPKPASKLTSHPRKAVAIDSSNGHRCFLEKQQLLTRLTGAGITIQVLTTADKRAQAIPFKLATIVDV